VLVVDPDGDVRESCAQSLSAFGMRVHEAVDGREALACIYSVRPGAVVVAAQLAFIDGFELCSLLRQDAAIAPLRIVGITTDASPEHAEQFRDLGADVVLVKPVPTDQLAAAIRSDTAFTSGGDGTSGSSSRPPRHMAKARLYERYLSKDPPLRPPHLRCPQCDGVLEYDHSQIGGVNDTHSEQWDYFLCSLHGRYQYRHRTRKLKAAG
jgi:twitching motility two-component system response regulator PilG